MNITKEMKRLEKLVTERTAIQSALHFFDRMDICNTSRAIGFDGAQTLYETVHNVGVSFNSEMYRGKCHSTFSRRFANTDEARKFRLGFAVYLAAYPDTIRSFAKLADKYIAEVKLKRLEDLDIGEKPQPCSS